MKLRTVIVIIVLALGIASMCSSFYFGYQYYRAKYEAQKQEKEKQIEEEKKKIEEKKIIEEKEDSQKRENLMRYLEENIDIVAQEKSREFSGWRVFRFGFVSNSDLYVYFGDNFKSHCLLVSCQGEEPKDFVCLLLAFFDAENLSWKLVSGNDLYKDKTVWYYEKVKERWTKAFSSDKIIYTPYNLEEERKKQEKVDQGTDVFRLNPQEVVKKDGGQVLNLDLTQEEFVLVSKNTFSGQAEVKIKVDQRKYKAVLKQLVKKGEKGIWTLISIELEQ